MFEDKTNPIAITEDGRPLTWNDAEEASKALSGIIPPRSLVFALCSNTPGALCGYLAMIGSRSVPVMLDAAMDAELLGSLLATYTPAFLWLPEEQTVPFGGWSRVVSLHGYALLKNPNATRHDLHPDLALLLTTSGSTGSPKFVRVSYRNLSANAESIAQYLEIDAAERPVTSLPMHYSYGLSVINSHLLRGATLLLTPRSIMEKEFWDFFRTQGATSIAGVPYTYQMLKRLRLQRMELPTLKTLTQAGGKLAPELVHEFAEWAEGTGRRFFVMYGQTEATARMSYLPYLQALSHSSSIGIAIPGGEFELRDLETGERVTTPETQGELIYRGPNVTMGYAENPEDLALGDRNHSELRTGDIAQFDAEGYYYIVGRMQRFIKIFGNRINLDQAEQLLRSIIPDCACTGTDDRMTIHVTEAEDAEKARNFMSRKLGLHPSSLEVRIVGYIPKNSAGKILYSQLQGKP